MDGYKGDGFRRPSPPDSHSHRLAVVTLGVARASFVIATLTMTCCTLRFFTLYPSAKMRVKEIHEMPRHEKDAQPKAGRQSLRQRMQACALSDALLHVVGYVLVKLGVDLCEEALKLL